MLKKIEDLQINLSKNKNGIWGFSVELGTDKGKRKQKKEYKYNSKKMANIAAQNWLEDYRKELGFVKSDISFEDYAKYFMEKYKAKNLKPSTLLCRQFYISKLSKAFKKDQMSKITFDLVQDIFNDIKNTFSKNYTDSLYGTLKMVFNLANEENITDLNISKININKKEIYASDVKKNNIEDIYLNLDEIDIFLKISKDILNFRYFVIIKILINTGLRIGELCALFWEDLKKEDDYYYLDINKTYFNPYGRIEGYYLLSPKTTKSIRKVLISNDDYLLLMKWKDIQNKEKQLARRIYEKDNFIFTNPTYIGHPIGIHSVDRYCKKVNIEFNRQMNMTKKITPHKLRHTHVSLLAEAGVPLMAIKERVGHNDGKITEKIYLHITKNIKKNTFEMYENYINTKKREKIVKNENKIINLSR